MKRMKYMSFILFLTVYCFCFSDDGFLDIDYQMHFKAISRNTIILGHIISNKKNQEDSSKVKFGEMIGTVEGFPENYSEKNDKALKEIEKLYNAGNYEGAEKLLRPIWEDEKTNPIYLYFMGRIYTRIGGVEKQCIAIFEKLIKISEKNIDENHSVKFVPDIVDSSKPNIIIDAWYLDAYWKLGLLYLEDKQYQKAIIQLTKALYFTTMQLDSSKLRVYEFILTRLAEAYYLFGDKETAKYYYNQILKINPNNTELKDIFK